MESRKRREIAGYSAREDHPVSEGRTSMTSERGGMGFVVAQGARSGGEVFGYTTIQGELENELNKQSKLIDALVSKLEPLIIHEPTDSSDVPLKNGARSGLGSRLLEGVEQLQYNTSRLTALYDTLDLS